MLVEGVDAGLDEIGVIIEKSVYCGKCNKPMQKTAPKKYECGLCHFIYQEK